MSAATAALLCALTGSASAVLGWTAGHRAGFREAVGALTRLRRAVTR